MTIETYLDLKEKIIAAGYASEIDWAEDLKPVADSWTFFCGYVWVVVNAGMREQVARNIYDSIMANFKGGGLPSNVFGHKGKCKAIVETLARLSEVFEKYKALDSDEARIEFLETLPFIGKITKYHLAKNLGVTGVAKPDRHLARIAKGFKTTAQELCEKISEATGDTVALVDLVIWRAANLGFV